MTSNWRKKNSITAVYVANPPAAGKELTTLRVRTWGGNGLHFPLSWEKSPRSWRYRALFFHMGQRRDSGRLRGFGMATFNSKRSPEIQIYTTPNHQFQNKKKANHPSFFRSSIVNPPAMAMGSRPDHRSRLDSTALLLARAAASRAEKMWENNGGVP